MVSEFSFMENYQCVTESQLFTMEKLSYGNLSLLLYYRHIYQNLLVVKQEAQGP